MELSDRIRELCVRTKRPYLTRREQRIARYIAEGYTTKEIETAEDIGPDGAKVAITAVYDKAKIDRTKHNPRVVFARAWIKAGLDDEIKPRL